MRWAIRASDLPCIHEQDIDRLEYFDTTATPYRATRLVDGRLESCIFIGPDVDLPPRDWLIRLFEREGPLDDAERIACACFNVGINTLTEAIRDQGLDSVEAIGEALQAGTNCGSCIPEIKTLLARETSV